MLAETLGFGMTSGEWWFVALLGLGLAVAACASVFRNTDLGGGGRALWIGIVVLFPFLGPAVYFGVRRDW